MIVLRPQGFKHNAARRRSKKMISLLPNRLLLVILQVGSYYILDCTRSYCCLVDRCDAVVILVDVSIKEDYEKRHEAFSAVIDIFIMLTVGGEKNYPIIKRFVSAMELTTERYQVLVAKECRLKIILPRTQLETFEKQRTPILRKLESMTNVDIKKVEVIQGSCHVILTLTAAGFIRFVCCLLSPESLWQLLSSVDNLVEIQLGNLLPVKLSRIEKFSRVVDKLAKAKASLSHFSEDDIRQHVVSVTLRRICI